MDESSCGEGIASHTGPESCVGSRKAAGEALTGERAGQPLSPEKRFIPGADGVLLPEGNTGRRVIASTGLTRRGLRPWHVWTLLAREPGDLWIGHWPCWAAGPWREGEEP